MESIAKALVIAVQHLADRDAGHDVDRDVERFEHIAAILSGATAPERRALEAASRDLGLPDWSEPEQFGLTSEAPRDA